VLRAVLALQLPLSTRRLEPKKSWRAAYEVDGGGKAQMWITRKGAEEVLSPAGDFARTVVMLATFSVMVAVISVGIGMRAAAHAAVSSDPMALVKTTVNQVVTVLQDKSTPAPARRKQLLDLVSDRFDFTDMARQTLGSHWNQLTPAQQQEFVPLFTSFMEDAYLDKIEGYSGQPIDFLKQSSEGSGYAEVSTSVSQQDKQPVKVDYRLKQEGDSWRVYDVTVDEISITANYRNQFNRVINNQGYDALVSAMRNKQRELQDQLAS
jgi:phospholipid transport system substrate-binding protein